MTPLRTIQLGSYPLRIYASPLNVPDHPWASFEDLAALAEMDEIDQDRWLAGLRRDVPDMLRDMPDGAPIIAEPMVGGLFQAWVMMGAERAQGLLDEWTSNRMPICHRRSGNGSCARPAYGTSRMSRA